MAKCIKAISKDGKYRIVKGKRFVLQRHWFLWWTIDNVLYWAGTYPGWAHCLQKWLIDYGFGFNNYFSWLHPKKEANNA